MLLQISLYFNDITEILLKVALNTITTIFIFELE